jgi:ABC-type polysaccharide/polyol phosphate export permease
VFSFLREAPGTDGAPGPLSMRRISAAACFLTAIVTGIFAIVAILGFIGSNPNTGIDWKAFIPLFIPCLAFLIGGILLLLFTTWTDIKELVCSAASLERGGSKNSVSGTASLDLPERPGF